MSLEKTQAYFSKLFGGYGLPSVFGPTMYSFASCAIAWLSTFSFSSITLGIYLELIERGRYGVNCDGIEILERG
jgi:hypothetical protein